MLSCGGRSEASASCPEQHSPRLVGQKLLFVECSAKGLVGHLSEMAARMKLLFLSEEFHERCATSDSLPATCRDLISLRIS